MYSIIKLSAFYSSPFLPYDYCERENWTIWIFLNVSDQTKKSSKNNVWITNASSHIKKHHQHCYIVFENANIVDLRYNFGYMEHIERNSFLFHITQHIILLSNDENYSYIVRVGSCKSRAIQSMHMEYIKTQKKCDIARSR